MVRAILDGRKTVTRRKIDIDIVNFCDIDTDGTLLAYENADGDFINPAKLCRYQPGDILYVRETWTTGEIVCGENSDGTEAWYADYIPEGNNFIYKEYCIRHNIGSENVKFRPSIHMPKEAARIWLKVTNVRVERLQDITEEQAKAEGIGEEWAMSWWKPTYHDPDSGGYPRYRDVFEHDLWDSTIKKSDIDLYGWEANPYVFVIEFERCEKPEMIDK
jgi:hypothetical protein